MNMVCGMDYLLQIPFVEKLVKSLTVKKWLSYIQIKIYVCLKIVEIKFNFIDSQMSQKLCIQKLLHNKMQNNSIFNYTFFVTREPKASFSEKLEEKRVKIMHRVIYYRPYGIIKDSDFYNIRVLSTSYMPDDVIIMCLKSSYREWIMWIRTDQNMKINLTFTEFYLSSKECFNKGCSEEVLISVNSNQVNRSHFFHRTGWQTRSMKGVVKKDVYASQTNPGLTRAETFLLNKERYEGHNIFAYCGIRNAWSV